MEHATKFYEIEKNSREMMDTDCPTLYLGNRTGATGYLDFITKDDLKENNIMKGYDSFDRKFIVIKAYYEFIDGKKYDLLTTFFQRYNDSETLWMSAGGLSKLLMHTDGGMKLEQFILLNELLKNGKIDLTLDIIYKCNLNCYPNYGKPYDEQIDGLKIPLKIVLGSE